MKISDGRILTTHVGSLPRAAPIIDLLRRKEQGEPYDHAAFDSAVRAAVAEIVQRQAAAGVDIVSDGETSKFGYGTYIKDRLDGFGGEAPVKPALDMRDYPELRRRMTVAAFSAAAALRCTCCIGPVRIKDRAALQADLANFRAALDSADVVEGFLNAASPRSDRLVPAEPALSQPRGLYHGTRRGDARGIRGDRAGRLHPAG